MNIFKSGRNVSWAKICRWYDIHTNMTIINFSSFHNLTRLVVMPATEDGDHLNDQPDTDPTANG